MGRLILFMTSRTGASVPPRPVHVPNATSGHDGRTSIRAADSSISSTPCLHSCRHCDEVPKLVWKWSKSPSGSTQWNCGHREEQLTGRQEPWRGRPLQPRDEVTDPREDAVSIEAPPGAVRGGSGRRARPSAAAQSSWRQSQSTARPRNLLAPCWHGRSSGPGPLV